ncbi:MAG: RNA polymerase factor sigma-54 [Alphaproteobacteria bacterium]|nr:RNA polymerase factor sigma-54 [Alphaproteobacteria bacterium]
MTVQTLDLRNTLQLRLTQKMQQAIKLLQMSNQELSEFVSDYIESNPLLEMGSPDQNYADDSPFDDDFFDKTPESDTTKDLDQPYTDSFENVWQDEFSSIKTSSSYYEGDDTYDPFAKITQDETLKAFLLTQIDTVFKCKNTKEIAYILTDLLDEDGYLIEGWEDDIKHLNLHKKDVDSILTTLQTLDPVGVFARSLEECLILQLKDKGIYQDEMGIFLHALKNHTGSPKDLAKTLNITMAQCDAFLTLLKSLNPKPGASIGASQIEQVIPDVIMRRNGQDWVIELNTLNLPALYLNSAYYIELRSMMRGLSEKNFLQEKYTEAKWLLKSLHQRAVNILKVTDTIIRKQADFFKSTSGRIRSLTLKEVALETNLSESTVSRVTTDKYIETPRGLFELKYFFSVGVNASTSDNLHSAKSVQYAIARLIQEENKESPLSDGDIVERLKLTGIYVARRTVAKYRGVLKIENATDRLTYYKWSHGDDKILAIHSSLHRT